MREFLDVASRPPPSRKPGCTFRKKPIRIVKEQNRREHMRRQVISNDGTHASLHYFNDSVAAKFPSKNQISKKEQNRPMIQSQILWRWRRIRRLRLSLRNAFFDILKNQVEQRRIELPTSCLSRCSRFTTCIGIPPLNPSIKTLSGADGIRTHDPLLAKQVLSQLSYCPVRQNSKIFKRTSAGQSTRSPS